MVSSLERLRQELEDAIASAGPSALAQAPAGKWNAAQILEHLYLTYKNTNRGMEKCLEQGAPLATRATLKQRVAALLVVNLGYLPEGRNAPERVTPRGMPPKRCSAPSCLSCRGWARAWTSASAGLAPGRKSWTTRFWGL